MVVEGGGTLTILLSGMLVLKMKTMVAAKEREEGVKGGRPGKLQLVGSELVVKMPAVCDEMRVEAPTGRVIAGVVGEYLWRVRPRRKEIYHKESIEWG